MMILKKNILALFLTAVPVALHAQQLYIEHPGKKKIRILAGSRMEVVSSGGGSAAGIGISDPPFEVSRFTADSLVLIRTTQWKDTFEYKFNSWTGKIKENKKRYYKVPAGWESRTFALNDIRVITYRYRHDQSGEGCIACYLIPGLNIYYIWSKSWRTKTFDMTQWRFAWK